MSIARRSRSLLLLCVVLVAGALRAAAADLLLAAATDAELQPLIARLAEPRIETRAAWQFWLGTIAGHQVVLTRTEGDPLNAVAATTLAIRRYAPKLVVTFGAARAHDPTLQPGDVVVSGKFAAFDGMISRYAPPGSGSTPAGWSKLEHLLMLGGEKESPVAFFPADAGASATAAALTAPRGKVIVGVLGSAAQINREADRRAWLREQWGTSTEDGESAHIAGCAQLLGVPVAGLRVVDGTDGEAAALVLKFLEALK